MLFPLLRDRRVLIVEDVGVRLVTDSAGKRLATALALMLGSLALVIALPGWGLTAWALHKARATATVAARGNEDLADRLAESRAQLAGMQERLEMIRADLDAGLAESRDRAARMAALAEALAAPPGRTTPSRDPARDPARDPSRDQALERLRQERTALERGPERLAAAGQTLETLLAASREAASLTASRPAAPQSNISAPPADLPSLLDGLTRTLAETQASLDRQGQQQAALKTERDALAAELGRHREDAAGRETAQMQLLSRLADHAGSRVEAMEQALTQAGLDPEAALRALEHDRFGSGGPLVTVPPDLAGSGLAPKTQAALSLLEAKLARQARLKALFTLLPLSTPVADFYITSGFGRRRDPFTNQLADHMGVDLVAPIGTPVKATAAGKVLEVGQDEGYGRNIVVDHGFGLLTRYAHLEKALVRPGDPVGFGEQIGTLGNSGRSSGPHVHYEIILDGEPVDPLRFMEKARHVCEG